MTPVPAELRGSERPCRGVLTCVSGVLQRAQSVLGGEVGEGEGVELWVGHCAAAADGDGGLPVAPTGHRHRGGPGVRRVI